MITGDELVSQFEEQVRQNAQTGLYQVFILLPSSGGFVVKTTSDQQYKGRVVILAQGNHPR